MTDIARIIEVVEPEAKALGFDLVRVILFGKSEVGDEEHTLQIMAERPDTGQLVIEDCAALSHRISDRIDALEEAGEVLISEAYRLEVSSPGIDRPLRTAAHFQYFTGSEAKIQLAAPLSAEAGDRRNFKGILQGVEDGAVVIACDGAVFRLPIDDIEHARLVPDWDAVMKGKSGVGKPATEPPGKPGKRVKPGHPPSQKHRGKPERHPHHAPAEAGADSKEQG